MPYSTYIKKTCLICNCEFETKNRQKKMCSRKCSGIFTIRFHKKRTDDSKLQQSIKMKEKYINDETYKTRVSQGLKKYFSQNPDMIQHGTKHSIAVSKGTKGKYKKDPKNIFELSTRTISKVFSRLYLGCSVCDWNEASCDLHHINGRKVPDANGHWNLCYVCPNCHRKIHAKKMCPLINLEKMIGNRWKEVYFG